MALPLFRAAGLALLLAGTLHIVDRVAFGLAMQERGLAPAQLVEPRP